MKKRSFCVVLLAATFCSIILNNAFAADTRAGLSLNEWPCLAPVQPKMTSKIPTESLLNDQPSLNCFAWQEFIALNWLDEGGTAATFGYPGNYSPVVFETYMNADLFFKADGSKPPEWGTVGVLPYPHKHNGKRGRYMSRTSKFGDFFRGSGSSADIHEAAPHSKPNWLADKHGNLVWYEVLFNKAEYDYLLQNKYYNAEDQQRALDMGGRIDMPQGNLDGKIGAIELKAAWLTIENPEDEKWMRYKTSWGTYCGEKGCKTKPIALVGLHIIHKTVSQPSWIWATFEHVDNAPDKADVAKGKVGDRFSFYSDDCKTRPVPESCQIKSGGEQKIATTSCKANQNPAWFLDMKEGESQGECKPYPIQVVREFSLPATNENPVVQTNHMAHQLIKESNPDSVYQYYNLVNVLWNDSPVDENKGADAPVNSLSQTAFRPNPNAFPVSNTMLETYVQNKTCIQCHSFASAVKYPKDQKNGHQYTSDYSFLPRLAGYKK